VRVSWTGEAPSEAERQGLRDSYLRAATLDSFHTGAVLKGKPTLMIQGGRDMAVPSPLGDALWERCGRPERWISNAGHELLFMRLPDRYDAILDWLDAHLPRPPEGERGP